MKRLHYAWVVAVVTWITLLAAAGFRSTPSTLIVPEHEFGWSRATISVAVSINLLLFGLFAPFAGGLMERFGVRRVVVGALMTVSAGSALTVFMTQPWQLDLLWGVVVGVGTGSMAVRATCHLFVRAGRSGAYRARSSPRPGLAGCKRWVASVCAAGRRRLSDRRAAGCLLCATVRRMSAFVHMAPLKPTNPPPFGTVGCARGLGGATELLLLSLLPAGRTTG